MSLQPALVILNPRAGQGQAPRLWSTVETEMRKRFALEIVRVEESIPAVARAWGQGTRCFIAAGGDGTVHALANVLFASGAELSQCLIGAVGLGSSNDFHKPFGRRLADLSVRLDVDRPERRDLGLATFGDGGRPLRRAFVISASVGACARANRIFNRGDALQRLARRLSTDAAVLLAGGRAVAGHRNIAASLRLDGGRARRVGISNLSVMKTPHLAGSLSYDVPVAPADGLFAVNLCQGMRRRELAAAMLALGRGRFAGRPKTRHWRARTVQVESPAAFDLELDGELYRAAKAEFSLLPAALRLCT